jgi:hypothetical protein
MRRSRYSPSGWEPWRSGGYVRRSTSTSSARSSCSPLRSARLHDVGTGPASLLGHVGGVGDAVVGAVSSVVVNNLPAATLLSAQKPPHPLPLLIGLNLGPNLLFTGSLSTYLWYQAARATGARPSLRRSFVLGLVLVPLTMATALGVLALTEPQAF